jgi:hypothetical protein
MVEYISWRQVTTDPGSDIKEQELPDQSIIVCATGVEADIVVEAFNTVQHADEWLDVQDWWCVLPKPPRGSFNGPVAENVDLRTLLEIA